MKVMIEQKKTQLPLFAGEEDVPPPLALTPLPPLLTPRSPLSRAAGEFEALMRERGFTENTQQAFRLDLQILSGYVTPVKRIGEISTATLKAFLKWLEGARGVPCSPKSLERRITTLKVFFGWLAEEGYLEKDVAAPLIHHSVTAPLPDILLDAQLQSVLAVTQAMREGQDKRKPDARPHLLVMLILHAGIKKSECVNIHLNHIDITRPEAPTLWIRYRQPNRRHKERRIALPSVWPTVLQEYRDQYKPQQNLFPWSARNLEYVLTKVARQAEVMRITFEMLRWTCAVRDFKEGMEPNTLRHKLGLSEISWYEVEPKLALLVQRK